MEVHFVQDTSHGLFILMMNFHIFSASVHKSAVNHFHENVRSNFEEVDEEFFWRWECIISLRKNNGQKRRSVSSCSRRYLQEYYPKIWSSCESQDKAIGTLRKVRAKQNSGVLRHRSIGSRVTSIFPVAKRMICYSSHNTRERIQRIEPHHQQSRNIEGGIPSDQSTSVQFTFAPTHMLVRSTLSYRVCAKSNTIKLIKMNIVENVGSSSKHFPRATAHFYQRLFYDETHPGGCRRRPRLEHLLTRVWFVSIVP